MRSQLLLTPLVLAVALVGCKRDEAERTEEPAGKAVDRPGDVTDPGAPTADMPEDYHGEGIETEGDLDAVRRQWVESTRDTLDVLDKKAAEARRELEEAGEDAEVRQRLDDLEARRRRLSEELEKAGERSEEQWDEFKRDLDEASDELEQSYNRLLEDLKSDN